MELSRSEKNEGFISKLSLYFRQLRRSIWHSWKRRKSAYHHENSARMAR